MPSGVGPRTGSLAVGARIYTLTGAGIAPPMPQPQLSISLQAAESAQQGTISMNFGEPALTSGNGTVTLQFLPATAGAADPAIAFASSGRSAPFTFARWRRSGHIRFRAHRCLSDGNDRGHDRLPRTDGDQQSVLVDAAPVAFGSAQASRSPGAIEVQVAGFDNTRTAGRVSFTLIMTTAETRLRPEPLQPMPPRPLRSTSRVPLWAAISCFAAFFQLRETPPGSPISRRCSPAPREARLRERRFNSAELTLSG